MGAFSRPFTYGEQAGNSLKLEEEVDQTSDRGGRSGKTALCGTQDAKRYADLDWGLREMQVEDCDVVQFSLTLPLITTSTGTQLFVIEAAIFRASSSHVHSRNSVPGGWV